MGGIPLKYAKVGGVRKRDAKVGGLLTDPRTSVAMIGNIAEPKKKRDAAEFQPDNVFQPESTWSDAGGLPAHKVLANAFVRAEEEQYNAIACKATYIAAQIKVSDAKLAVGKGYIQYNCYTDSTKFRKDCICSFGLNATVKPGSAKIKYVNFEHNNDCQVYTTGGRTKGAMSKQLGLKEQGTWASGLLIDGTSMLKKGSGTGLGGSLMHGMQQHHNILLSKDTCNRIIRESRNETLPQSMMDMTQLAPYLLKCRDADPDGIYMLGNKEGTYELDGIKDMQEFEWLLVVPSYMIRLWEGSYARIMSIDMAHRHAHLATSPSPAWRLTPTATTSTCLTATTRVTGTMPWAKGGVPLRASAATRGRGGEPFTAAAAPSQCSVAGSRRVRPPRHRCRPGPWRDDVDNNRQLWAGRT